MDDDEQGDPASAATYCCLACRLLQDPTTLCVHCGASMVAPIDLIRDLLGYRDMRLAAERDLGLITALLAGGSFAVPILLPFALASLAALLVRVPLRRRRERELAEHHVAAVALPAALPPPQAVTIIGGVKPFRSRAMPSLLDGIRVVAEEVSIARGDPRFGLQVLMRRSRAVPFLVEPAAGGPILVVGEVRVVERVAPWIKSLRFGSVKRGDPLLARMGVPADMRIDGQLHGDRVFAQQQHEVEVTGCIVEEPVPEFAFHRDPGVTRVMRGEPGRPVLVATHYVPTLTA
jgi:hypothetical protein